MAGTADGTRVGAGQRLRRRGRDSSHGEPTRGGRFTRLVALGAAGLVCVGTMALSGSPAAVGAGSVTTGRRATTPVQITFDRHDTLRRGSAVHNANGRVVGKVMVADHGRLGRRAGHPGKAAQYPCRRCGRAIIEIPNRRSLNPRARAFTFGLDVKVGRRAAQGHSNLVQKGYFKQSGGQYKLQMHSGVPSCVVTGALGRVRAAARPRVNVANGRWHRLSCERTSGEVVLRVDGRVRARTAGATGPLASSAPLRVGGKNLTSTPNAQYHGRLDNVVLRMLG